LHAFQGDGDAAEVACAEARACSPVDPLGYLFDAIAASAAFTNRRYEAAIQLAQRARRADRYHASSVRVLAMSLALLGQSAKAAEVARELLQIEPHLTVSGYLARAPSASFEVGRRCAEALRMIGIPES
jgi:hypothetical protein